MKNIFPIKAYFNWLFETLPVQIISVVSDESAVVLFPNGDINSVPLYGLKLTNEEIERFFSEEGDN